MILKYLKDQGGQFWGAFAESLAQSLERAKDRPLKDAMLKAQIGHQQAVTQKLQMDIEQAKQHQAALDALTQALQPEAVTKTTYDKPFAALEQTGYGETNPPAQAPDYGEKTQTELRMPDVRSPKVQGALVKAQPKEAAAKLLAQTGAAPGMLVQTWADAVALQNDPTFQSANPYGGRWVQTKNGIQFQGIHPVNPEAAIFHGPGGASGAYDYAYNRGAAAGAGGYAGRTAQEVQQPIQPRQPFAGQPGTPPYVPPTTPQTGAGVISPGVPGVPTTSQPGETQEQTKQRLRKEAQLKATPLSPDAQNAQFAASKISGQADLLLKGFSDDEINKFAGVFNQPIQKGKSYIQAGAKALGMGGVVDQSERDRFSAWQTALAQLKQVAFDVGGKQLTPFEANVVFGYVPTGSELNGGTEIKQKIENMKTVLKAGADVRLRLAREGRANIDPLELDRIMQQELSPLIQKLQAGQPNQPNQQKPQGGNNIINYNGKQYVIQNGALFEVK